jgi:DNA-binding IclR family transcriptional regulator
VPNKTRSYKKKKAGTVLKILPGAQSLHRAISLLRTVARHNNKGARLSQLSREVSLHVATARRLLTVLTMEGLTAYDPNSKCYSLGIGLYHLGSMAQQFTIRDQLHSTLEEIASETEDTVFLLVRSGNDALCIDRVEGKFPIRALTIDVGMRRPLGVGAGSLALIAFLPDEQFKAFTSANEHRYPEHRNLNVNIIQKLAKRSRKKGYVLSDDLFWEGVISISVPIYNKKNDIIAAITVTAIADRMTASRQKQISSLLKSVATKVKNASQ